MTVAVLASAKVNPLARASRLLRATWRGLTLRKLRFAVAVGVVFGVGLTIGVILRRDPSDWRIQLALAVSMSVNLAVTTLVGLTFAANVRTTRWPKWVPFVTAALAAGFLSAIVDIGFTNWLMSGRLVETSLSYPLQLLLVAPNFMLVTSLAALAYAQALDARRQTRLLRNLRGDRARVARQTLEARLVALQARVEPRFLFETLSDVERLYDEDASRGAKVLDQLIVYLRALLPAIEASSSTLAVELELAGTWLDIMRIRSGGRLAFAIKDEAPGDATVAPMLLLPLVQCAAESGSDRNRAVLLVTAESGGRVCVTVIGPASAFSASAPSATVDAVRERLDALYGDTGSLALQPAMHDRSQAILEIPYERADRRPR